VGRFNISLPITFFKLWLVLQIHPGIGEGGATLVPIVTLGCYASMNESEQRYEFYKTLVLRVDLDNVPVSRSCFVALTDAGQYGLLNDALGAFVNPVL